jgi:hypothetical protein
MKMLASELEFKKTMIDNQMDETKLAELKRVYALNPKLTEFEGIVRSLPEYQRMPDMATVHSGERLKLFTEQKNVIKTKALQVAKSLGIDVSNEVADIAFQKTLSEDKKISFSELKPTDYYQGDPNKNPNVAMQLQYNNYKQMMETFTHRYMQVYGSSSESNTTYYPEDNKSLVARKALDKLRDTGGFVNASKAQELVDNGGMTKEEYDSLFNDKDGFYTVFAPGGVYDQLQGWMVQNIPGWYDTKKSGSFNLPVIGGSENIMRYKGSGAAINFNGQWIFNPAEIEIRRIKSEQDKQKLINEMSKKSILQGGERPVTPQSAYYNSTFGKF